MFEKLFKPNETPEQKLEVLEKTLEKYRLRLKKAEDLLSEEKEPLAAEYIDEEGVVVKIDEDLVERSNSLHESLKTTLQQNIEVEKSEIQILEREIEELKSKLSSGNNPQ
ncbi:MAG: hypothetical protein Q7S34_02890 [bacterium]|nr:hypothetical protein [bacterium]